MKTFALLFAVLAVSGCNVRWEEGEPVRPTVCAPGVTQEVRESMRQEGDAIITEQVQVVRQVVCQPRTGA